MKYTMSEQQLKDIMEACKPVPYLVFGGMEPRSPQENANDAWERLGEEMGFDYMTVKPGGSDREFFAEPITKPTDKVLLSKD